MKKLCAVLVAFAAVGCEKIGFEGEVMESLVTVEVESVAGDTETRAVDPDENKIQDINIFVFNGKGLMEEHFYASPGSAPGKFKCRLNLHRGVSYSFYAVANTGFRMNVHTLDEVLGYRYYFVYPDDYSMGIPMAGYVGGAVAGLDGTAEISIPLKRIMAKLSVRIDRRRLDPDVRISVNSIKVGASPRSVLLWQESRVENISGVFASGFTRSGVEVEGLNNRNSSGVSDWVELYVLENLQGDQLPPGTAQADRYFGDGDVRGKVCSWIELNMDYISSTRMSPLDKPLIYRFYVGEGGGNFDVRRNNHYRYTVTPCGDGLGEDSWRVDGSSVKTVAPASGSYRLYPGNYIECSVGDTVHVWCELTPASVRFDVGIEELEFDSMRGIYSYKVDPDGHGVTLTMLKKGSGLLYFEMGPPIDSAEAIVVVCDP